MMSCSMMKGIMALAGLLGCPGASRARVISGIMDVKGKNSLGLQGRDMKLQMRAITIRVPLTERRGVQQP
jgi:hypothetical protein